MIAAAPGNPVEIAAGVLVFIGLRAFVLDAFEIILVIVPVVMPPVLIAVPDAAWLSVLTLLVLQASFLVPPFGYAVMMARSRTGETMGVHRVVRGLAPFLAAQLAVAAATLTLPPLTHLLHPMPGAAASRPGLSDEEVSRQLRAIPPIVPQK
jgi:TRAP-type mannitol/chloroaromatic compound transport system permease large subunit